MRIDEWITWPWWVVMLPAFIVDAFLLYMCIGTFPILFAKMKENKTLDEQERLPITYPLLMNINVIIFVVAQVCFVLCLDRVWKVNFTTALIPYFIYALKYLYMPFLNSYEGQNKLQDFFNEFSNVIVALTVYLVAAKHDGIITWDWELTFLFVWIYYGLQIVVVQCMRCGLQATRTEVRMTERGSPVGRRDAFDGSGLPDVRYYRGNPRGGVLADEDLWEMELEVHLVRHPRGGCGKRIGKIGL